jgi:hypothetical protein
MRITVLYKLKSISAHLIQNYQKSDLIKTRMVKAIWVRSKFFYSMVRMVLFKTMRCKLFHSMEARILYASDVTIFRRDT